MGFLYLWASEVPIARVWWISLAECRKLATPRFGSNVTHASGLPSLQKTALHSLLFRFHRGTSRLLHTIVGEDSFETKFHHEHKSRATDVSVSWRIMWEHSVASLAPLGGLACPGSFHCFHHHSSCVVASF